MENICIPLVIPVYEPDERFLSFMQEIKESDIRPVIVVNDGSGKRYRGIFDAVGKLMEGEEFYLITHQKNKGKGRALKNAFVYVVINYKEAIGVVTADSDGQHTLESIQKVRKALLEQPECLVLGSRNFEQRKSSKGTGLQEDMAEDFRPENGMKESLEDVPKEHIPLENVPWKSRFGNRLTRKVLLYVSGMDLSDTQTGLRGIPKDFMEELIGLDSDRFEFEMQMILATIGKRTIVEIPVPTIYESKENHQTHFRPIVDSFKIYRILCRSFYRYVFASLSSSVLDLLLFRVFCTILREKFRWYIAAATGAARIISAICNYTMNHEFVFRSKKRKKVSLPRYAMLAGIQMVCSALFVTGFVMLLPMVPELLIKIVVDTGLFFLSYKIQQKFIF